MFGLSDSEDLKSLYQEIILDHGKNPRNQGTVEGHTCDAKGNNPLCGDRILITARVDDGFIEEAAFTGKGCAISIASASMMTEIVKGRTVDEFKKLFASVHGICTAADDVDIESMCVSEELEEDFGRLAALGGVRNFPMRVKCATLAWHALLSCLEGKESISTE